MRYVITRTAAPRLSGFDTFFSDFFGDTATRKIPPVDIYETENGYVIEAEIAGYSEKDVEVILKDGILTISSLTVPRLPTGAGLSPHGTAKRSDLFPGIREGPRHA